MRKKPKIQQLIIFATVAEMGSISAAAKKLFLSQPALTRSLKELEEIVGVELVVRGINGISLTEIGKVFNGRVQQILSDMDKAIIEIENIIKFTESTIKFGFSSSLTYSILPDAMKSFQNIFPNVCIELYEGQITDLVPYLRQGTLDFAIGIINSEMSKDEFLFESLFSIPYKIIARKGHPLENCTTIKELQGASWCLPSNSFGYQKEIESIVFPDGINGHVLRGDSGQIRINMVLNANYLTLEPDTVFSNPSLSQDLTVIPIKDKIPTALYCIIYKKTFPLPPVSRWLIDEFKRSIDKFHC